MGIRFKPQSDAERAGWRTWCRLWGYSPPKIAYLICNERVRIPGGQPVSTLPRSSLTISSLSAELASQVSSWRETVQLDGPSLSRPFDPAWPESLARVLVEAGTWLQQRADQPRCRVLSCNFRLVRSDILRGCNGQNNQRGAVAFRTVSATRTGAGLNCGRGHNLGKFDGHRRLQ